MIKIRKNDGPYRGLKFWLFCLCGTMGAYLVFQDRFVPVHSIWNNYLWLLLGSFIFGVLYQFEFFVVSFWLMLELGAIDLILGMNLNVDGGPSCWSGFAVWIMTLAAGFAGSLVFLFVPRDEFLPEGSTPKN